MLSCGEPRAQLILPGRPSKINKAQPALLKKMLLVPLGIVVLITGCAVALLEAHRYERDPHFERFFFAGMLSEELSDAPMASTPLERAEKWLRLHRSEIAAAEKRFAIDRRAIGGLIAYEAVVNIHVSRYAGIALWSGPGKVHFKEHRLSEGDPLSKQIEELGMLPRRSMQERQALLRHPKWAALYIAGSMRALANVVRQETGYDISCSPGALVTLTTGWDLKSTRAHFAKKDGLPYSFVYNFSGNWVTSQLSEVQRQVGRPAVRCETSPTENRGQW